MALPTDPQFSAIVDKIKFYGNKHGVDPQIGIWQLWQESRFRTNAKSPVGAAGIAQFMPATAKEWGVDVTDLDSSIEGWARYMSWLLKHRYVNGDYKLALAAYNGGIGNVGKYNGIPPFEETQNYVKIIMRNRGSKRDFGLGTLTAVGIGLFLITKIKF